MNLWHFIEGLDFTWVTPAKGGVVEVFVILCGYVKCVWLIKGYCQLLKLKISVHPTISYNWILNEGGESHKKIIAKSKHKYYFTSSFSLLCSHQSERKFVRSWHKVHLFNVTKQASFRWKRTSLSCFCLISYSAAFFLSVTSSLRELSKQ